MNLDEFLNNFAQQFEETDIKALNAQTAFKDLKEWSSLHALSIIAMADEIYGVKLTGEDIRKSITINDLYITVKNKK